MFKSNYHTHTYYSDGKNSPTEMIESAIALGFTSLGFSDHAYMSHDGTWCMTEEQTVEYYNELKILKEKYKDKINIYIGLELDALSDGVLPELDFTLGSVHYIPKCGTYMEIDHSGELMLSNIEKYYGGDVYTYCEEYYELVSNIVETTHCDFIGHIDLVTKFNEGDSMFDTKNKRYVNAWKKAVDKLLKYDIPFEINTGAIARKKRLTPYPALDIADYIASNGGKFILTSDCHDAAMLDCFFKECEDIYGKYEILDFEDILKAKNDKCS